MLFNSIDFLLFFPAVTAVFLFVPKKCRYLWLLAASYYFYMGWNPKYALLLAFSTLVTYGSSIFMEACGTRHVLAKKCWAACSLVSNLGLLGLFKYADFILVNLERVLTHIGVRGGVDRRLDLLLPVGISFYIFQALGYTFDVYKGEIKAERNIFRYALFVSFFPQLVAGPVERSKHLLPQLRKISEIQVWDFDRMRDGFLRMLWGLFQKLVIADRAALLVDTVICHYESYGFFEIVLAAVLFAVQIYCDFGGYSDIARGAAKVFGISLMQNFRQPYLAVDIRDFWRRWHRSLTSWFTDYLYIPLGGNRCGILRKYLNILLVFGISGLWHGASWNFVAWGLLHAVYQIAGDCRHRIIKRMGYGQERMGLSFSARLRKMAGTFLLVDFAWIFFASKSLRHACGVIRQMFTVFQTAGIYETGLDRGNWACLSAGIALLLTADILHEKQISVSAFLNRQECWFRWTLYVGLAVSVVLFGIYGVDYDAGAFIYFQF